MITLNGVIIFPCTYFVLSFMLSFLGGYHLCYHLMLSFFTVSKCYHFYVIIFPCTYFVLSFMLSFDVIIYCYHFPPFFFFLKTWHTRGNLYSYCIRGNFFSYKRKPIFISCYHISSRNGKLANFFYQLQSTNKLTMSANKCFDAAWLIIKPLRALLVTCLIGFKN